MWNGKMVKPSAPVLVCVCVCCFCINAVINFVASAAAAAAVISAVVAAAVACCAKCRTKVCNRLLNNWTSEQTTNSWHYLIYNKLRFMFNHMIYTLNGHAHLPYRVWARQRKGERNSERTTSFNCRTNYDKLNAHQCLGVAPTHTHKHKWYARHLKTALCKQENQSYCTFQ